MAAERFFDDTDTLNRAIEKEVFPAVFSIRTRYGVLGTAFSQHPHWLASNAHIIQDEDDLKDVVLLSHQLEEFGMDVKQSFHRPSDKDSAPDLVIVNFDANDFDQPSIKRDFTENEGYEKFYSFYVDVNSNAEGKYEIRCLKPLSKKGAYPMIYECQHGQPVNPGTSGAPIVEARVYINTEPKWQFRVVGVLYARCNPQWYNQNSEIKTSTVADDVKLVCAIPLMSDFDHVLKILLARDDLEHEKKKTEILKSFTGPAFADEAKKNKRLTEIFSNAKILLENAFKEGMTPLSIALPDGLEKLWVPWEPRLYYGHTRKKGHPKLAEYNVENGHSNHHIVPFPHLSYLWDYLNTLDKKTEEEVRQEAEQYAEDWECKQGSVDLEKTMQEIKDTYDQEYQAGEFAKAQADIQEKKKKQERQQYKIRYDNKKEEQYKRFYLLMPTLLPVNIKSTNSQEEKTFFCWAWWNLFKGWGGDYRNGDPYEDKTTNDRSEKIKPVKFNGWLWNCLKHPQIGLYACIEALQPTTSPDQQREENLYQSMNRLALLWSGINPKNIHPYNEDEWVQVDAKNGHPVYRLK